MAPLAALIAVSLVAASPAAAGSVRVVSDVAACPSPQEVQSALRQVLGEGQAVGGWTLWYGRDSAAPATEREASLLMELADPAGERLVSRRIPTPAGDCGAIGTAIAAVVERSLRDLGWTRGEALPESVTPLKPAEATSATPEPPLVARTHVPRLLLGAGPMLATSPRLGVNLLLELRVRVAGPLVVRLGGGALASSAHETVPSAGGGRVTLSSRSFSLAPMAAFFVGPVELSGGPVVWLTADQASSSDLPKVGSGTRLVVAVGAGLGAALALGQRWRIGLALDGARVAFAPDTYVSWNGTRTTVLTPSPWQGTASAKLEFVPWP